MKTFMRGVMASLIVSALGVAAAPAASAQDCFLGEVRMFAGNFTPRNWAKADGQILPIAQHTALFSILGTMYGGDGRTTFALPDLRGRAPVGTGQGAGLTERRLGEKFGQETTSIPSVEYPEVTANRVTEKAYLAKGSTPFETVPPSLGIGYYVCIMGIFPSRS